VLVSSHLLSDLERVVTHVLFLREGKVQLFIEWDEAMEHLRCVPARLPDPTSLHWSAAQGGRSLVDVRHCPEAAREPALGMEDLLEVLNT